MSTELEARASAFKKAASDFADASERDDPEAMEGALQRRKIAFDEFMEAAKNGIDTDTRRLVEEVLALDQTVQQKVQARLSGIRNELDRIHHARRVVTAQTAPQTSRFVSKRA
ncbi:MAG: hypothetical protein GY723_04555 [bacterium]|nr:hypothetical protein [bacterium]MCP5067364.1 hypothetical protein [bacterium]